MRKTLLLSCLLLFFPLMMLAQQKQPKTKTISAHKQRKIITGQQINDLKNGALLVRLQNKKSSVDALRKAGNEKKAAQLEKKQYDYNLSIINAFRTKFNFCPTYFFFSEYSDFVSRRQFGNVRFLNSSMQEDTSITFGQDTFLTAEFNIIKTDTVKRFSHYTYVYRADSGLQKEAVYYGGTDIGFSALIIGDDHFAQLCHPFPFYTRTFDSMPIQINANKVVRKMNKKLFRFYKRKNRKRKKPKNE